MPADVETRKEQVGETFQYYLQELHRYAVDEHMGFVERFFGSGTLNEVKEDIETQAGTVIDAAADYAVNETPPAGYHTQFLDSNPFYQHYTGRDEQGLEDALTAHFDTVVEDAAPLFDVDVDDPTFGNLMQEAYDTRETAEQMLEKNFEYAETLETYASDMYVVDAGWFNIVNPSSFERTVMPKVKDAENWLWENVIEEDLNDIYGETEDE